MKVLLTGSRGLVGHSVSKIAGGTDMEWVMLTRDLCDLCDWDQVDAFFQETRPDVVVHLASRVGGVYFNTSKNYRFFYDNIRINTNVIEACRKYKVRRLINVLSTCIFPDENVHYPLTSDQLHNGLCHHSNLGYAYSKRVLHVGSHLLAEDPNEVTEVVNLTPTNLYGENDNYNLSQAHVIPALVHKAMIAQKEGTPLKVLGSGRALRQFLFSDDLAKVILQFITLPLHKKEVSVIVSPPESSEISIGDIAHSIADHFGVNDVVFDMSFSDGQYKKTTTDIELKKYLPDFQFTPFKIGLSTAIKYFTDNQKEVRT